MAFQACYILKTLCGGNSSAVDFPVSIKNVKRRLLHAAHVTISKSEINASDMGHDRSAMASLPLVSVMSPLSM